MVLMLQRIDLYPYLMERPSKTKSHLSHPRLRIKGESLAPVSGRRR